MHVVCDRFHVGESVYPEVLGRKTQLDDAVRAHVELLLLSRGVLVVYVDDETHVLASRLEPDKTSGVRPHHMGDVRAGFHEARRRSLLGYEYVWFHDDVDVVKLARRLVAQAGVREERVSALGRFTTYVGGTRPAYLLLGDVRNGEHFEGNGPAFAPYPGTSGHYLMSALASVAAASPPGESRVWEVGIANACDVDDPEELWNVLGRPPVVALGNRAHARLTRLKIEHGTVSHPQHWRRFFHHYAVDYAEVIQRAATTSRDLRTWRPSGTWYDRRPRK